MISHIWKNCDEYYVDTAADLYAWDVSQVDMGTIAYVIETGRRMILNGNKEWKEYVSAIGQSGGSGGSGGGGSSASALPAVTEADNGKILKVVNGQWAAAENVAVVGGNA